MGTGKTDTGIQVDMSDGIRHRPLLGKLGSQCTEDRLGLGPKKAVRRHNKRGKVTLLVSAGLLTPPLLRHLSRLKDFVGVSDNVGRGIKTDHPEVNDTVNIAPEETVDEKVTALMGRGRGRGQGRGGGGRSSRGRG